jgi:hypothetical protein
MMPGEKLEAFGTPNGHHAFVHFCGMCEQALCTYPSVPTFPWTPYFSHTCGCIAFMYARCNPLTYLTINVIANLPSRIQTVQLD